MKRFLEIVDDSNEVIIPFEDEKSIKHAISIANKETDIPLRFLDARFCDYPSDTASSLQELCVKDNDTVCLLCGPVGTGKSRYLVCALHERAIKGLPLGAYLSAKMLCPKIRASMSFSAKTNVEELYKYYSTVPFLCYDEAGKAEDWGQEWNFLNVVLSARYDNNLPTWIATNLDAKTFGEFIRGENNKGEDVYDRIKSVLVCLKILGQSYRQK